MTQTFKQVALLQDNSEGETYNGARTNKSSLSKCLDFFFLAGSSRNKDIRGVFKAAYQEDRETALRILLWTRDIRGGAGERQTFRNLYHYLPWMGCATGENDHVAVSRKVPEIGRWDDLWSSKQIHASVIEMIKERLDKGDALLAKWLPRDTGKHKSTANDLAKFLGLTPKQYRKRIVSLSSTVEQKMCAKEWSGINYSHVPSVASARYQKAFGRNDSERYGSYLSSLENGDKNVKINTAALFPHDVIHAVYNGNTKAAEQQWKNLPDYLNGKKMSMLPLIDVSGSMTVQVSGGVTAKDIALGLGIYCTERIGGAFNSLVMTFSSSARIVDISDETSISAKMRKIDDGRVCSTNIEAAFGKILEIGLNHNVPQSEMPEYLLILSDMEFNQAVSGAEHSAMDMMKEQYKKAGYEIPKVIFWNLNGRKGNFPVTIDESGTALISGYSPSIMTSIVSCGGAIDPFNIMMRTVYKERYDLELVPS